MTTFNYLLCLGMLCIALMNSSCTKENFLEDQISENLILAENPIPNQSDSGSGVVVVDGGVIIYDTLSEETDTNNTTEEEGTVVVDGGIEINETIPDTQSSLNISCRFTHTATVQLLDCGWGIELGDRTRLHPYKGGDGFEFEEGMRVKLAFSASEWVANDCMEEWGVIPVELICIEVAD